MTAKSASLLFLLAAFLLLTACGGGGGGSSVSFTETPELSPSSSVAAGPGTEPKVAAGPETSEPNAERQQTAEEQRILAQRQREREENDAAWLRYLDSLEPGIRADQAVKKFLRCRGATGCVDSFLDTHPTVRRIVLNPNVNGHIAGGTFGSGTAYFADALNHVLIGNFRDWTALQTFDIFDDDEYLFFGAWATSSAADRGGYAIGAEFSAAEIAALPAAGTATYTGGGLFVGTNEDDFYSLRSRLNVVFGGGGRHSLSGTLTEVSHTRNPSSDILTLDNSVDPKFILNLGESVFRLGEFSGGAVTCGGGGKRRAEQIGRHFQGRRVILGRQRCGECGGRFRRRVAIIGGFAAIELDEIPAFAGMAME